MKAAVLFAVCAGLAAAVAAAGAPPAVLRVVGVRGGLRLYRLETEPWPVQAGSSLPEDALVELDPGCLLRLRYDDDLDFDFAGPGRFEAYSAPSPETPDARRVILKLDRGCLLVDGRFQFGRPADVLLGLPDRNLVFTPGQRFFVRAQGGRSAFYLPLSGCAGALVQALPQRGRLGALAPCRPAPAGAVPADLCAELTRPVPVFVLARDYDEDIGLWPRPPVLGPLLAERLAQIPGITVVAGSGDTRFAYRANGAIKKGQDDYLEGLARARGARWLVVGNCVTDTPPGDDVPGRRWIRGQAEVRLLEDQDSGGGLELVSESAVTSVARAGRPLDQAARQAFEAASDAVSRYVQESVEDLLQGRTHAKTLIRLEADNVDEAALRDLEARLDSMDSVRQVFRRSFARHTALFDLILRRSVADFEAQWAAVPASGSWTWKSLPSGGPNLWRVRAQRGP